MQCSLSNRCFRFRRKHSGITGIKLHAGRSSSSLPSDRPPGGGFGLRDGAQVAQTAEGATESEQQGLMGRLPRLGAPPRPPQSSSPPSICPSLLRHLLPCCRPKGMGRPAEGNGSAPAPPGHYRPHTCCLRMPTASPACLRGLTQPPLMGMSHFRHLARGVHMCGHAASELFWIFSVWLKHQKMSLVLLLRHHKS